VIATGRARLSFERIDLRGLDLSDPIAALASELRSRVPALGSGAIAIVDSPRSPRDIDSRNFAIRVAAPAQRAIDVVLRRIVSSLDARRSAPRLRFAMFPTPELSEFERFACASGCKPHLAAIGRRIFQLNGAPARAEPLLRGRLFTRFMLVGFATHLALDVLGSSTFEGYPFLAFSLWKPSGAILLPKSRRDALDARIAILKSLARTSQIRVPEVTSLDEADAAVLALSVAACDGTCGVATSIAHRAEGRFLMAIRGSGAYVALAQPGSFGLALDKHGSNKIQRVRARPPITDAG
jgi:hypothetical protein